MNAQESHNANSIPIQAANPAVPKPEYEVVPLMAAPPPSHDHTTTTTTANTAAPLQQHNIPLKQPVVAVSDPNAPAAVSDHDPTADTTVASGQPVPHNHLAQPPQPVPDVDVEAVVGQDPDSVANPLHAQEQSTSQPTQEQLAHHDMHRVEPASAHQLADPSISAEPQPGHVQHQIQLGEMPIPPGQTQPPSSPVHHPHHQQIHHSAPPQSGHAPDPSAIAHPVSMPEGSVGLPPVSTAASVGETGGVVTGIPNTVATSATATPVVSSMGVISSNGLNTKLGSSNNNNSSTLQMPIPVLAPAPAAPSPHASATVPSLSHGFPTFTPSHIHPQSGTPHHMDLHENGSLLQFGATATEDVTMANVNVGHNNTSYVNGSNQSVRVVPSTGDVGGNERKTQRLPGTKQCPSCQSTIAAALAQCNRCAHVFRAKKEKPKRSGKRGKKNCPKCGYENPSACSSCKKCKYVFRLKLMDRYKQMRPRDNNDSNNNVTNNNSTGNTASGLVNVHHATSQLGRVNTTQSPAGVAAAAAGEAAVAAAANVGAVSSGVIVSSSIPPLPINSGGSLPMPSGVQQYHAPLVQVPNAGYTHVAPLNPMPQSIIQVSSTGSNNNNNSSNNNNLPLPMSGTVTALHNHHHHHHQSNNNNNTTAASHNHHAQI